MSSENPISALLGAWLLFQIGSGVVTALAALYALFCLGKTASAMERLASAIETLAERQPASPILPGQQSHNASNYGAPAYNPPSYNQPSYAPYPPASTVAPPAPPPAAPPPPVAVVVGPVVGPSATPPDAAPDGNPPSNEVTP
jgi:hypothetical protein